MTSKRAEEGSPVPIELEPAYAKTLAFIQQGQWADAGAALAHLASRYPAAAEVQELRQRLAFHLSAEQTWSKDGRRLPVPLRPLGVRVLLFANLLVYLLLVVGWVVGESMGLLGQATLP